jgi:thiol-disulfide isomerase/thioredoxin
MQLERWSGIRTTVLASTAALAVVFGCIAADESPPSDAPQELVDGNELVLVYFGATNCGPCREPSVKAAVMKAKSVFAERAAAQHRPYATIGVALDTDVEKGIKYLKSVGPFDEVSVGRSFDNSAVLALMISDDEDAMMGIPQLIIYERTIEHRSRTIVASAPKILVRVPGTGIPVWVNAGAKLE